MNEDNDYNEEYFEQQRFEEERREEEEREEEVKRTENEKQRYDEEYEEAEKQQEEENKSEEEEQEQKKPFQPTNPYAAEKTDFFDVNFDRLTRRTQKRKEAIPGKTNANDAVVVGLIAVAFIFTQAMSWMAVVAGIGGGIFFILSWRKEYRAFRLYASAVLNAGGIIGGLIAYFSYLFG